MRKNKCIITFFLNTVHSFLHGCICVVVYGCVCNFRVGVCACMCDCVVFDFFPFLLSVMLVLLHFTRNKLNTDQSAESSSECGDPSSCENVDNWPPLSGRSPSVCCSSLRCRRRETSDDAETRCAAWPAVELPDTLSFHTPIHQSIASSACRRPYAAPPTLINTDARLTFQPSPRTTNLRVHSADIGLQRGRFRARSLASCIPRSCEGGHHKCSLSKSCAAAPVVASSSLSRREVPFELSTGIKKLITIIMFIVNILPSGI